MGGLRGRGAEGPSPVSAQLQSTLHCWAGLSTPGRSEVPGLAALAVGIALSKTKCIVVGGWKQGRMVIGLRFFHTLGTVGLFQDCEQGGGRIPGPGEDFVSSAAQGCPSLPQERAVTTPAHPWVSPGAALPHTPRARAVQVPVPPGAAADGAERTAGRSRTPAGGSSLLGTIPMAATLTVPQDRRGQSWKKPTMECEVEYGW